MLQTSLYLKRVLHKQMQLVSAKCPMISYNQRLKGCIYLRKLRSQSQYRLHLLYLKDFICLLVSSIKSTFRVPMGSSTILSSKLKITRKMRPNTQQRLLIKSSRFPRQCASTTNLPFNSILINHMNLNLTYMNAILTIVYLS